MPKHHGEEEEEEEEYPGQEESNPIPRGKKGTQDPWRQRKVATQKGRKISKKERNGQGFSKRPLMEGAINP
jgi:hypothetical protein